jgi:hypothetical protein
MNELMKAAPFSGLLIFFLVFVFLKALVKTLFHFFWVGFVGGKKMKVCFVRGVGGLFLQIYF